MNACNCPKVEPTLEYFTLSCGRTRLQFPDLFMLINNSASEGRLLFGRAQGRFFIVYVLGD